MEENGPCLAFLSGRGGVPGPARPGPARSGPADGDLQIEEEVRNDSE